MTPVAAAGQSSLASLERLFADLLAAGSRPLPGGFTYSTRVQNLDSTSFINGEHHRIY
jgi:hypothetical protein